MSTTSTILYVTAHILIWTVALAAWAFVARYTWRTWWRTNEGRHLMAFTVVFALLFTLTGLMPHLDIADEVSLAIQGIALLAALSVIVWRHVLLTDSERDTDPPNHHEEA